MGQELTTGPGLKVCSQGICRRKPARHDETCNYILIKLPQSNQYLIVMLIVDLCTVFFCSLLIPFFSVTYSYVTFQVCNFSGMYYPLNKNKKNSYPLTDNKKQK